MILPPLTYDEALGIARELVSDMDGVRAHTTQDEETGERHLYLLADKRRLWLTATSEGKVTDWNFVDIRPGSPVMEGDDGSPFDFISLVLQMA